MTLFARARGLAALLAIVLVAESAIAAPSKGELKRAKALFDQGVALSDDGQWADALAAFEKSDKTVPSLSVRYNIGATLRALGRYVEAKKVLKAILKEGPEFDPPIKPALEADVQKLLDEVKQKIVVVTINAQPAEGSIEIDGADAKLKSDGSTELDPGKHVFVLTADGYETTTVSRDVRSATTIDLIAPKVAVIEKRVEVHEEQPFYASGWFLAGAGVAVAGGVAAALAVALKPKAPDPAAAPKSTSGLEVGASYAFHF